ncbi:Hypothetical protein KNT65_gp108 [Escherichia phage EcS1]|uniref:Uncharacterized protein n=1 Tax=Escherichia phage EcS1 TaxID=2083276 RepID=A0A2Z5ZCG0_9CAUD|nr:Hypothetical protein KNT65_gp108 [Escherichia phage EcS1]BBC78156.1 Hypothetical protein [Escherichia phage EcS1]
MIGHSKNVSKTKLVEFAVGDNIYLDRGRYSISDWTKYIIRLIHKTPSKTVMYAQHLSSNDNHLIIIDLMGKTYTMVNSTSMNASNLGEMSVDSIGNEKVTFNEAMMPCKMKRVSEPEFTPVVASDILFKDSKCYTVVAVAPDGTLFLTDPRGKASMVNPRDNTAIAAFGLQNA